MLTRIYINKHIIRANKKNGTNDPPISVRTSKELRKTNGVFIDGPSYVIYNPDKPLSCGATVWIETEGKIVVND